MQTRVCKPKIHGLGVFGYFTISSAVTYGDVESKQINMKLYSQAQQHVTQNESQIKLWSACGSFLLRYVFWPRDGKICPITHLKVYFPAVAEINHTAFFKHTEVIKVKQVSVFVFSSTCTNHRENKESSS